MRFLLTEKALDVEYVAAQVAGEDAGALVTFTGTVRGQSKGKRVVRLEYEAYEEMALGQLEKIAGEAAKFGGARVAVHHRLGACGAGEPTVCIVAAAAHRADAFDACRHVIERLKADVAVWKREVYEDGSTWVGQGS